MAKYFAIYAVVLNLRVFCQNIWYNLGEKILEIKYLLLTRIFNLKSLNIV